MFFLNLENLPPYAKLIFLSIFFSSFRNFPEFSEPNTDT